MAEITQERMWEVTAAAAERSRRFSAIKQSDGLLRCDALEVGPDAWYQVGPVEDTASGQRVWVGLYIADRWLSESIEADVLHQGDSFEELLEEELVDQGLDLSLDVEHFRDDAKVFVFRSALNQSAGGSDDLEAWYDRAARALLAYEACYRELGDMQGEDEEL